MKLALIILAVTVPTLWCGCAAYPVRNVIMTTGEMGTLTESKTIIHH
jgi:hypothetical protein